MKIVGFVVMILISAVTAAAQGSSSSVDIITVFSQNEKFYLRSVPFDREFPTVRGKTSVYETGNQTPLYVFERGFDSVDDESNNLILSNDGETIFYLVPWLANDEAEGLKSVTIYQKGKIVKSYTEAQITGCDNKKERCQLGYSNDDKVVDREKSGWGTGHYKKAFKDGVDEKAKFLNNFPIFSFDDTAYLTDSKMNVHLFDLRDGSLVRTEPFDKIFEQIRDKGRFNKIESKTYKAALLLDFPKLKTGAGTEESLAAYLDMEAVHESTRDEQYKWYSFKIDCSILRDGSLEIEGIDVGPDLPKDKISEFFKTRRFDTSSVPAVFEKWYLGEEYFYFRKKNAQLARKEKQQEKIEQRKRYLENLTLERIDNVYIPKDLGECFVELDRLLPEIDKKEIQALPNREGMASYHMGLGMWMRNNWGLWGGSRLQKYFMDRGVNHPDDMSGVVLRYYYDWIKGTKDSWRDWEKKAPTTRNLNSKQP